VDIAWIRVGPGCIKIWRETGEIWGRKPPHLTLSYVSEIVAAYPLLPRTLTRRMEIVRRDSFMVGFMQLLW
jgi:hypothetical protein